MDLPEPKLALLNISGSHKMKKLTVAFAFLTQVAFAAEALHENPIESLYKKGLIQRDAGDLVEAKGLFMQVVEADNKHTKAMHNLGSIHYKEKDFKNAADWFGKAAQLGFMASQRNLWRMIIAKEINAGKEERFLAVCDLMGYVLPVPRKNLRFNLSINEVFTNSGSMECPSFNICGPKVVNSGTLVANVIWAELEDGFQNTGHVMAKLIVSGTKKVS